MNHKETLNIPVYYTLTINDVGQKTYEYDFEAIADAFEDALCELDDRAIVMCSVETQAQQET